MLVIDLMVKRIFVFVLIIFSMQSPLAQINDLGGVEYTSFFGSDSHPFIGILKFEMNLPLKLSKKDQYLVNGLSYENVAIHYNTQYDFETNDLDRFHILKYTLGYTFRMSDTWRFTAQVSPSLASNFVLGTSFDDFVLNGSIILIRTIDSPKKNRLTLGLAYNQTSGIPFPLPFITYFREISTNLNYTVGVPISKMKYYFGNKRNSVEGFVRLAGFFANMSRPVRIESQNANQINLSAVVVGAGYDYYIGKRLNLFVKTGYLLRNELRLQENARTEVFNFDIANTFYARGGFKFNF